MYHVSFPGLGLNMLVDPVALTVGSFKVYWYGIIIGIGFALALAFAMKNMKRFGIDSDGFIDCVIVGLLCGIFGARLYYVVFRWGEYYSSHTDEILSIHSGGLAIYGGVIGGLLGGCIVARLKKLPIPAVLDISVMGFLIGQGLGRWGNFFNQEAFGTPTDLPWRMVSENTDGVGVHPCFLYESIWCLLGFVMLYAFSRRFRKYDGQIFLLYLVWYGLERMLVEGLRTDSLYTPFLGLRVSQILAAATALAGIILLFILRKRRSLAADKVRSDGSEQEESVSKKNNNDKKEISGDDGTITADSNSRNVKEKSDNSSDNNTKTAAEPAGSSEEQGGGKSGEE